MSEQPESKKPERKGFTQSLNDLFEHSGAALIVILALVLAAVVGFTAIAAIALFEAEPQQVATITTSAFTAIGTIAGLYSGVRLGAEPGRKQAERESGP